MGRILTAGASLVLAVFALTGCGGPKIAPVSGVVTMNGVPYRKAVVSFQPIGSRENPNPGRGSVGVTDEHGRYTLIHDGTVPGALVGSHRVRIFTEFGAKPAVSDKAESSSDEKVSSFREPIPPEWHEESQKVFEVTREGTDKADFDIVTKK